MADKGDMNAKWDACADLTVRRLVYSSLAGAFGGLLLFRTPVTRWASVAFGAGIGIGSAYSDCSHIFSGTSSKAVLPKTANASVELPPAVTSNPPTSLDNQNWDLILETTDRQAHTVY